jgi:hypothetical protein
MPNFIMAFFKPWSVISCKPDILCTTVFFDTLFGRTIGQSLLFVKAKSTIKSVKLFTGAKLAASKKNCHRLQADGYGPLSCWQQLPWFKQIS